MWLHAFSAALHVVPLNGPLLAKSNCHICKRFVFPTDLCNPFTVLCPEKSSNKLIFCASGNVKQEEGELRVGQGAGCRQGRRRWTKHHLAHTPPYQALSVLKSQALIPIHQVYFGAGEAMGLGEPAKE